MANTFKKIQTVTVGSGGAANIDFTSIPQTYTDLKIVLSLRGTRANNISELGIQFNGVTTSSYNYRVLRGNGASADSFNGSAGQVYAYGGIHPAASATASVFGSAELYIPNYTSANNKSFSVDAVQETNGTTAYQILSADIFNNTAAITSIKFYSLDSDNFAQYSTATLYGVANANTTVGGSGKATGGQQVYTDGSYWYHIFRSDGNFVPTTSMNVDYLVVAGGGAVRRYCSGGGGGGGVRCTVGATGGGGSLESQLAVTPQTYAITVGAGGAGASAGGVGNSGSNSIFSSITSTGGGGAGAGDDTNTVGNTGGSGGGNGYKSTTQPTPAAGTTNQGYAGGQGNTNATNRSGGGGGGAGGVGGNASTSVSGAGGAGVTTSISGTSTSYAGGGSGGAAAGSAGSVSAGGGAGAVSFLATQGKGTDGTANTGGGAGGSPDYSATATVQANGGSGIVIVRYAA